MSSFDLLQEIRGLLKGNLEKNQTRAIAIFTSALESTLAGIESTVDIVEVTTDYTASARNSCVLADASSGDVNVYLPKAEDFINYNAGTTKLLYVKKADAGGSSVIIHADVVDTIEGNPTHPLTSPLEAITLASDGNDWFIIATNGSGGGGGGSGDVVGPASATDNAIARFNLTSGKLIQNSPVTISDLGSISLPVGETVDGRDLSVDGSKLDGIEAGADVTDAANVNAAGAVMESDFTTTHAILVRQGAATPAALAIPFSSFVGRISSGDVIAMTASQAKTLLAIAASEVSFTPDGDIAATTVQTAIVEVRNDTDTKLGAKVEIGGQLGGTISSPTVIAVTETSGPTALTIGAIADGEYARRVGGTLVGATPASASRPFVNNYLSGRYYAINNDQHPNGLALVTGFLDRCDVYPWYCLTSITPSEMGVYCTTGVASGEVKIGVYAADGVGGAPGTRTYLSAGLSVAVTNSYAFANTGLPSFVANTLYWFLVVHNSAAQLRALPLGSIPAFGGIGTTSSGATQGSVIRRTGAGLFASPPSPWAFVASEITPGNTPPAIIVLAP